MPPGPLFPYVRLEFTRSLGPPPGRYPVLAAERREPRGPHDALLIAAVGVASNQAFPGRRARAADATAEPRELSLLTATWVQSSAPIPDVTAACSILSDLRGETSREAMVSHVIGVLNRAIRAYATAAGDPYSHEVSRWDPREVQIGIGPGEEADLGKGVMAFTCPPPLRDTTRSAERLRPSEAVVDALTGRSEPFEGELRLLRALLDLDHGRTYGATLELKAAVELFRRVIPELSSQLVAEYLTAPLRAADVIIPEDDGTAPLPAQPPSSALLEEAAADLLSAAGQMRRRMRDQAAAAEEAAASRAAARE